MTANPLPPPPLSRNFRKYFSTSLFDFIFVVVNGTVVLAAAVSVYAAATVNTVAAFVVAVANVAVAVIVVVVFL